MPDNYGRATSSEVSEELKAVCYPQIRVTPHEPGGYYVSYGNRPETRRWGATRAEAIQRAIAAYESRTEEE